MDDMTNPPPTVFTDYVNRINSWRNAPARIKDGKLFYLIGENEISKEEWESANPPPGLIKRTKNINIDTTNMWYD